MEHKSLKMDIHDVDSTGWPSTSQTDWKTTQKEEMIFEDC